MKKKENKIQIVVDEEIDAGDNESSLSGGISPYRTSDLGVASALHCRGFSPLDLDRSDQKRVEFLFNRTRDVMSVVSAYWDSSLAVDAHSYFNSIRFLKNRLYSTE